MVWEVLAELLPCASNGQSCKCCQCEVSLFRVAAVQMERGEHAAACSSCSDALALDPKNVKGLVRRAQCHLARHEHKVKAPIAHIPDCARQSMPV